VPSDFSLAASVCPKPVKFSIAAITSLPSLAFAAHTKSAKFSLPAIAANLPSLPAACSKTPKSSLNAVRSKHSVAALASWSPPCPCYETNVLVYAPQTLAIDLAAAASVTAAPVNTATIIVIVAIAITHASRLRTYAASAFVNRRRIAQSIRRHRSQTE
jgi:hypothetical protein